MSGEGGASRGDGDGEGSEVDMMEFLPPPSHLSQLRLLFRGSSRLQGCNSVDILGTSLIMFGVLSKLVQGLAKRLRTGCVNAAGKPGQK